MLSCIDEKIMARYIGNTLSAEEKEQMEAHLSNCELCRQDFVAAQILLNDETMPMAGPIEIKMAGSLFEKIKQTLGQFYEWVKIPMDLEPVCVRSNVAAASIERIYFVEYFDDLEAEIHAEKMELDKICIKISLLKQDIAVKNIRLTLIKETGGIVSRLLKDGRTVFDNLSFGDYQLIVGRPPKEKGSYCFEINEKGLKKRICQRS